MRLIVPKGPSWTCELCHNRANPARSSVCLICNASRPQYRFALQLSGQYFICKVKTTLGGPCISVCTVSVTSCLSFSVKVAEGEELNDAKVSEILQEHFDNEERRQSSEKVGFPELETEGLHCGGMNDGMAKRGGAPLSVEKSGSFLGMFDPGLSLFDKVMHNATTVAYNSNIGQYVSVKTMQPGASMDAGDDGSIAVRQSLSYVESMRKERVVMTQVVKEVVRRRADDTYLYDSHADLDLNRNEWDKEQECAMCQRSYPKSQMPGQISFKAIADWKASHGAPLPPTDHRLDLVRLHDATRLCSFCTQFFDTSAVDRVDKTALKEKIGISQLNLNGPLNCSNTVYKRMFRKATSKFTDVEDRPISRMRHRVALEHLRFKSQSKNNTEARYTFNPKFPNLILDQEKVGTFLRTKYAGQSTVGFKLGAVAVVILRNSCFLHRLQTGSLLLAERKSVKLKLTPLGSTPGTNGESAVSGGAFLTDASGIDTESHSGTRNRTGHVPESSDNGAKLVRRSLSAGRGKPEQRGSSAAKHVHRTKSDPAINRGSKDNDKLARINNAYKASLASTAPGSPGPNIGAHKSVSFDQDSVRRVRRKRKKDVPEGKDSRKPLILKLAAAAVVGNNEMGKVIEIELRSSVDPGGDAVAGKGDVHGREDPATQSEMLPTRKRALNPLRGLLSNMQISRIDPAASTEEAGLSPGKKAQNFVIVDKHQLPAPAEIPADAKLEHSPQGKETKKSLRFQPLVPASHTDVPVTKNSLPPLVHERSPKALPHIKHTHKTNTSKGSPKHSSAAWKHNINKPVLRDVFETSSHAGSKGKHQDHSYITQVPRDDDFTIDEAYSEDPAANSDHDSDSVGSLPGPGGHTAAGHLQPHARSDSFDEAADEYSEDGFEVEEGNCSPSQLRDTMQEGGSMDGYNWVSAGPYLPPCVGDDGDADDTGFSPVMFESSLLNRSADRMRMLSRGSAGGLLSPASRGMSAARRYSGQHTPKLLSSAGSGITPFTPTGALSFGGKETLPRKMRSQLKEASEGVTFAAGVSSGRFHSKLRGQVKAGVVRRMEPLVQAYGDASGGAQNKSKRRDRF
jgi:hypothetical protein